MRSRGCPRRPRRCASVREVWQFASLGRRSRTVAHRRTRTIPAHSEAHLDDPPISAESPFARPDLAARDARVVCGSQDTRTAGKSQGMGNSLPPARWTTREIDELGPTLRSYVEAHTGDVSERA